LVKEIKERKELSGVIVGEYSLLEDVFVSHDWDPVVVL
jgi:hypothetical protein